MSHFMPPQSPHSTPEGFSGLGIAPQLLETLRRLHFRTPTPIQARAIPLAIEGKDIVGIAQTGTGKTLAFGVPLLQRLALSPDSSALVLLPTRELALQVEETLAKIAHGTTIRAAVFIGGVAINRQKEFLRARPRIIIATPGRLNDLLEQRLINLQKTSILVLDEADRMLDMGFLPQIKKILNLLPRERQTMLFSATMPREIVQMASQYMKLPLQVEIARAGSTAEKVIQELFVVNREDKLRLLEKLLTEYRGSVLVFSRTKHGARKITRAVRVMGHTSAEIHSNRSLSQRTEALSGFRSGKYRVLVATDIAARGIHVSDIELVINFDVPEHAEDYVHRIGRTGRAGQAGRAITFSAPDQSHEVRDIQRLIGSVIPRSNLPELPPARSMPRHEVPEREFRGDRGPRGRRPGQSSRGPRGPRRSSY